MSEEYIPVDKDYDVIEKTVKNDNPELSYPVNVKITYENTITNNGPSTLTATTYFAVPPSLPNQEIKEITFSPDSFIMVIDNWGQQIAYYTRNIDVGKTSTVSYTVEATLYYMRYNIDPDEVTGEIPKDILDRYTTDEEMYKINDPVIMGAVEEAVGDEENLYWKAWKIHDYIKSHLYYKNDHRWDDAPTVLSQGHGSCTEYTWLFIAMCRAAGIPARYVGGTHYGGHGQVPYYDTAGHRWAQIYLPNYGWIPVDVTFDDSGGGHTYFGATNNQVFVTTISGGPSNYLGWRK